MKRFRLLTLLLLSMATTTVAQGPPGFGPPGRGPGMRMPPGPPSVTLLVMPEVQKELAVSDEQRKQIAVLQDESRAAMEDSFRNFDPREAFNLSEEERIRRFEAMREKSDEVNRAIDAKLSKVLSVQQQDRWQQLQLQREGVAAFLREDMVAKLKLTDAQKKAIADLQPTFGFGPPRPNPRAMQTAIAVLTDEQKKQWSQLTGTEFKFPEPTFGPGGFGGPGGPLQQERKLLSDHDRDGDGKLNAEERKVAREAAKKPGGAGRGGPGGFGPRPGGGGPGGEGPRGGRPGGGPGFGRTEPGRPGPRVSPEEVTAYPDKELYDTSILRTLFLNFENDDWEAELADFHNTDVEVPATLLVDGKTYPQVGVHFRGMSSYGMVPAGSKRSLNVSLDFGDPQQRLYGYKTLNLLNAHEDPSFLHTVLYSHIARQHIPAPKANLVKVVINGESWGVYVSAQQFDKIFVSENFKHAKGGTRWKVRGSPGGGGGLDYIGDNIAEYQRRYEMKSDDNDDAWRALIKLCKTLEETPPERLEAAIEPLLDIDGVLWFLAIDNALINSDGYWVRGSDYCLFRDGQGKFHVIPHDMNEAFHPPMGPGAGFGRKGSGGIALDPLVGLHDDSKPLRSRLLAVPSLQQRYLLHVRVLAEQALDWKALGPVIATQRALIADEVAADTRKLSSFSAFEKAVADAPVAARENADREMSLRQFAELRRKALLDNEKIKYLSGQ